MKNITYVFMQQLAAQLESEKKSELFENLRRQPLRKVTTAKE